jgi:hypothetical protein
MSNIGHFRPINYESHLEQARVAPTAAGDCFSIVSNFDQTRLQIG